MYFRKQDEGRWEAENPACPAQTSQYTRAEVNKKSKLILKTWLERAIDVHEIKYRGNAFVYWNNNSTNLILDKILFSFPE